jgi:hypothetical protein
MREVHCSRVRERKREVKGMCTNSNILISYTYSLGIKSILKEKRVKYFKYSACYITLSVDGKEGEFTLGNEFSV